MFVTERSVVMDNLCLQNCIRQQTVRERIAFEQLNHHAANLVRSTCITDKVSITIKSGARRSDNFLVTITGNYGLSSRYFSNNSRQISKSKCESKKYSCIFLSDSDSLISLKLTYLTTSYVCGNIVKSEQTNIFAKENSFQKWVISSGSADHGIFNRLELRSNFYRQIVCK
jgi:hypothetical protein